MMCSAFLGTGLWWGLWGLPELGMEGVGFHARLTDAGHAVLFRAARANDLAWESPFTSKLLLHCTR